MLSRVAETLYWTARYVERAENIARLVNVNNLLLMDLPKGVSPGWEPLIDIIGSRESYTALYQDFSEKHVLKFLTVDERNPSSIVNSLKAARDNTRTIREVVPREMWEAINELHHYASENVSGFLSKQGRFAILKRVTGQALRIYGTIDASMSHDHGYFFWRFGSALERADMTTRIIDVRSAMNGGKRDIPFENLQWISVLRSLSAYQMYRQSMGVRVRPGDVLTFMLHDRQFPRSVMFCLYKLKALIEHIPNNEKMLERIEHSIVELEKQPVDKLEGDALHDYIDELQIDLADIHQQLAEQYFLR